ncbi:complex I subunit 5 family protein [Isachenkonia alkalipeptolytica]|uniref:NADH:quinone oxidoreductase/Mrp antiporter transmembrane domain-containing protein n=1 Tax=Isachenkonia alkalipeptolytica TaxID=2565777 RepID=A0AA44BD07_9CLOT|nr:proton-conducting transporter membrane subunit [Isachenkonia alkalipeptolytica]NBG87884.1 hypothetical protein [Isachenkonia alkalipeptolytica]
MSYYPIFAILIPIIFAIVIYLINDPRSNLLAFIAQGALLVVGLRYFSLYLPEGEYYLVLGAFGDKLNITLISNTLTYGYGLLSVLLWFSVILYSWPHQKQSSSYYFFLLFLQGVFMGIVHAHDFFNLFLFIEIATILSGILIIYKKDGPSLRAGIYYIVFNTAGILLFLIGLSMLYRMTGTLHMGLVQDALSGMEQDATMIMIFVLMCVSMGVKSAFFPVYNWLPRAHSVSTSSISAVLSGIMVKSGVLGLYKIQQVFPMEAYKDFFILLGMITALCGLFFGISQTNIKRLLAFSTISHIGFIVMGLSSLEVPTSEGVSGALVHIVNHGFLKILLFLGAGSIVRSYKTYDLEKIRGVLHRMPLVGAVMLFGILSIMGTPLLLGYQGKALVGMILRDQPLFYLGYHFINLGTLILFGRLLQILLPRGSRKPLTVSIYDRLSLGLLTAGILFLNLYQLMVPGFGGLRFYEAPLSPEAWLFFLLYLLVAYLFIRQSPITASFFEKVREYELSFQAANYMMVAFIFIMLLWSEVFNLF